MKPKPVLLQAADYDFGGDAAADQVKDKQAASISKKTSTKASSSSEEQELDEENTGEKNPVP